MNSSRPIFGGTENLQVVRKYRFAGDKSVYRESGSSPHCSTSAVIFILGSLGLLGLMMWDVYGSILKTHPHGIMDMVLEFGLRPLRDMCSHFVTQIQKMED
jgi:hypothetical protein